MWAQLRGRRTAGALSEVRGGTWRARQSAVLSPARQRQRGSGREPGAAAVFNCAGSKCLGSKCLRTNSGRGKGHGKRCRVANQGTRSAAGVAGGGQVGRGIVRRKP